MAVISIALVAGLRQTVEVVAPGAQKACARSAMVIMACQGNDSLLFVQWGEMLRRRVNGWYNPEI